MICVVLFCAVHGRMHRRRQHRPYFSCHGAGTQRRCGGRCSRQRLPFCHHSIAAFRHHPSLPVQGPEAVRQQVLAAWADYLGCPEVATRAFNFAAIDWPSEQVGRGACRRGRAGAPPITVRQRARAAWSRCNPYNPLWFEFTAPQLEKFLGWHHAGCASSASTTTPAPAPYWLRNRHIPHKCIDDV